MSGGGMASRFAAFRDFVSTPRSASAVLIIVTIIGAALLADVIAPMDPNAQDYMAVLKPPSLDHLLGTDNLGRDLLSRLIHGSRVALFVGLASVGLAAVFGSILGLISGYASGVVDEAMMRVMDALFAFPSVLLALGITAALGPGTMTIVVAIAVADTPVFARLTRGQVLSVRERDFVTAARALGAEPGRLIFRHIWPHVTTPVVVMASLHVGFAILTEAALSFLGLGVQPPTASWGGILRTGFAYLERAPWLSAFSGAAILIAVFGLNLLADALRDYTDPRASTRPR